MEKNDIFCRPHPPIKAEFPEENFITFKNFEFTQPIPVVAQILNVF